MSDIQEFSGVASSSNVTLTTTSETVIISSPSIAVVRESMQALVLGIAQLTTGASTTAVTPRIRQGTTTGGTLVSEANAVTIGAAAGSTEQFLAFGLAVLTSLGSVQFSLTLQQTGAAANGTALAAAILVLLF